MRILARRDPIDPLWRAVTPEVVLGDIGDDDALARLCAGTQVVINVAGLVKARSRAAFDAVNVDGARRAALAARDVAHVVQVSSLTAREPARSHYGASKAAGEAAMRAVLGPRLTIVRPCVIYGPGDRELLPVFQAADQLPLLPVLSPDARVAMIHVADAARQIVDLSAAPSQGLVLALSDGQPEGYSWRELMSVAAHACGRTPGFLTIPNALLQLIGITNDFTALLGANPMLTSAKVRELLHPDWAVAPEDRHSDALPAAHDLSSGFSDTVAWYRSAAWMRQ